MASLILIRGACATGKSTRMTLMLRHLVENNSYVIWSMKEEPKVLEENTIYNQPMFGFHFADINVFVVAKYVKGRDHYIGLDAYSLPQEQLDRTLESMNHMNVIIEGFMGCMPRYRRKPPHILGSVEYPHPRFKDQVTKGKGFEKMLSIMFLYDSLEEMQKRVSGRGGKHIDETCSSWRDNKLLISYAPNEVSDYPELADRITSLTFKYDAGVNTIKDEVLKYLGI